MNSSRSAAVAIRGEILTCFTSAVATYLSRYEVNYAPAIGLQSYFACKFEGGETLKGTFVHQHRSLNGESPLYSLSLCRRWETDREAALAGMRAEWHKSGHLIVVGDAFNLPWLTNHGKKHAAHWFVVEEVDEAGQRFRIRDPFEFADANGTQAAYEGWIPLERLPELAKVHNTPAHPYLARDLFGFGDEEDVPLDAYQGYQWFEATAPFQTGVATTEDLVQELHETLRQMTGQARREDLLRRGFVLGLEAVAALADQFREHLSNPDLYEMGDDFWVAGRQRQLFAHALRHLAAQTGAGKWEELAAWVEEKLAPLWLGIPRLMLYNASCLVRKRPPKDVLIQQAEEVYRAEQEFITKLEELLT
ncbi:MAG TPA: hypothetical protein VFV52_03450 [Bacilli bacterium]|nr:hypothetical protein [Bacilli bacterium]